jgi:hypothetical protein
VLPSHTYPAAATAESSLGLWLPTAHEGFEVHASRAKPARSVPSSGFGYPLDGLLPRIPGRFYFAPAALLGFALRRFPLSRGLAGLSTGSEPTYRSAQRLFRRRSVGPARGASVPGFMPPESAWRPRGVLSRRPLAPPLGFAPLGSATKTLARTSSSLLSHASRVLAITRRTRWRLRVSIGLRSALPDDVPKYTPAKATLVGFLHLPVPEHSGQPCPGYWLHLAPGRTLLPALRRSWDTG